MTGVATVTPALAAEENERAVITVIGANRLEQNLQDASASITVFTQEKLDNAGIISAKDIATYTPGVYAQTRFGNDTTTYTIRGFAQEQRTTATVGVYFAEVVAPRGNGVSQGGDGASPGSLFDLEGVEVVKGPTGTLFGRNTTGGAVLIRPVKPRDEFEGYVEGTVGNLNRWRVQGVVNLPISDTFRIRLGVDRHKRDGYIKNVGLSARHDPDMGSIDITAFRASAVWDITEAIENYTIFQYSESKSSGAIPLIKSNLTSGAFLGLVQAQQAVEAQTGNWWTGTNANPFGEAYNEEMRIINRTTIELSDDITLTNIFGYAEFKGNNAVDAFGFNAPVVNPASNPTHFFSFVPIYSNPDYGLTANQRSIVEELRLNGTSGRLKWQIGLYYEKSSPMGFTGTLTSSLNSCFNIQQFDCGTGRPGGSQSIKVWNTSYGIYGQATYEVSDQFSITGGLRWTEDKTRADWSLGSINFAAPQTFSCQFPHPTDSDLGPFANTAENRATKCRNQLSTKTSAPTWTIVAEFRPVDDVLLYAKWLRGYRQGGLSPATGIIELVAYDEEEVDTFEIGAKTSWNGAVRGTFNVAGFYNDFRGQQIQIGFQNQSRTIQSTLIANANKSYMYGFEADLMLEPSEWVKLEAAYSYNKTKLKSITNPDLAAIPSIVPLGLFTRNLEVGGPIPLAVPHAFNATLTFKLPVPESAGDISLSGTIVHMSKFRAVADAVPGSGTGILPKRTFGNVNLTWKNIGGGPVDAIFSVTNVTNEKIYTHVNDQTTLGLVAYSVDEPRQYMMRVKYRFGRLAN